MVENEDEKARNEAAQIGRATQLVKPAHSIEPLGVACMDRSRSNNRLPLFLSLSLYRTSKCRDPLGSAANTQLLVEEKREFK